MQTLFSYVLISDKDDDETIYKVPRSVLSQLGMESPLTAVYTGIFGTRSNSTVLPYLNKHFAPERGQRFCPVVIKIPLELNAIHYFGVEEGDILINDSKILNMQRLRSDLIHRIQGIWVDSGAAERSDNDARFPYKPTEVPQYIDTLRSVTNFPQLELILYQVATPAGNLVVGSAYVKPVSASPWTDLKGTIEF